MYNLRKYWDDWLCIPWSMVWLHAVICIHNICSPGCLYIYQSIYVETSADHDLIFNDTVFPYFIIFFQVQVQVYLFPSLYTKCKNSQVKYI